MMYHIRHIVLYYDDNLIVKDKLIQTVYPSIIASGPGDGFDRGGKSGDACWPSAQ